MYSAHYLVDNGFNNIRNLNDQKKNYPYADLYAERGKEKYVISLFRCYRFVVGEDRHSNG